MRKLLLICLLVLWSLPSQADYGGSRGTYLKFELEKVSIVSIEFHGIGARSSGDLKVTGLPARIAMTKPQLTERMAGKTSSRKLRKRGPASARMMRKRDAATGLPTGKRQHKPFTITKPVDKATPLLQRTLSSKRTLRHVVLHGRDRQTGKRVKIILHGVKILSQKRLGGPRASRYDTHELEEIAFTYQRIEVE